jgi:regulator of sigma E protease
MNIPPMFTGPLAILVTLAILAVLVIAHELGHFVVARWLRVRVHEFGIGFPPRAAVLGKDSQGTIYTLNWLPVGGFVRLEGEYGPDVGDPHSFSSQSFPRKAAILVAGVTVNLILAFLILTLVTAVSDFSIAIKLGSDAPGTLAANLGLKAGDAIEAVDGQRRAAFDGGASSPISDLAGHSGTVVVSVREAGGSVVDHTVDLDAAKGVRIGMVQPDSPASSAGLVVGDVLLAADGRPLSFVHYADASAYLRSRAGQQVTLTVQHADGRTQEIKATLRASDVAADRGALGVAFDAGAVSLALGPAIPHDAPSAIRKGGERTVQALGLVIGALGNFVNAVATNPTQAPPVSGVVGIVFVIGGLIQTYPPVFLLWIAGVLSANLALINILPIPPFDGGGIVVAGLQALFGERATRPVVRFAQLLGVLVFVGLFFYVTAFDLLRGFGLLP